MPYVGLPADADLSATPAGGYVGLPADAVVAPQRAPAIPQPQKAAKTREEMQKEFASRTGTAETAARYGVTSGDVDGVPKWGREHPNLYALYGAAKSLTGAAVEGAGTAGGAALGAAGGALTPVPGGALMGGMAGGGAGYAAAKRLNSAVGLSDEPVDNSAAGIGKDVALGAAMGAVPEAAGILGKGLKKVAPTAARLLTEVPVGSPARMLADAKLPDPAALNAAIDKGITKAIRPSVASGRTAAQAQQYADNARTAVKEIVLNKDNLALTDEFGEAVDGLPQNLQQFRQAVDTTKKSIWDRVETINAAAGKQGATVPLQPAVNELNALSNNSMYRTMSPETVDYAAAKAKLLGKQGAFTVKDAQDAISMANQSLKNFYASPSPDSASRAYVDSLIANHLRAGLDTALEEATGTAAAPELRQSYGALKAIEKDVNQRATVDARKNTKGLIDFTDIYTAGELAKAMATMNPAAGAKALTWAAVKNYIKLLNDPNTHVKNVFQAADKLVTPVDFPLPESAAAAPAAAARGMMGEVLGVPVEGHGPSAIVGGNRPLARGTMGEALGVPTQSAGPSAMTGGNPAPVRGALGELLGASNSTAPVQRSVSGGNSTAARGLMGESIGTPVKMGTVAPGGMVQPPKQSAAQQLAATPAANTWKGFLAENMGRAMKEEGSHGAAMQRLSKEWKLKQQSLPEWFER